MRDISFISYTTLANYYHLLTFSPLHNPKEAPVLANQSLIPLTACLAILSLPFDFVSAPFPGLTKLLPSPVAYSLPILGSTFSPALSAMNSEKGTSQTQSPKYADISVKVGNEAAMGSL